MGVLTYKGATARESLGSEAVGGGRRVVAAAGRLLEEAHRGRRALRAGRLPPVPRLPRLGLREPRRARPLTTSGPRRPRRRVLRALRRQPVAEFGNNVMPVVREPRRGEPRALGEFLDASKGPQARCGHARLPRHNGRLGRPVRGSAARGARRRGLRGRDLRLERGHRGARDRAVRRPSLPRDEIASRFTERAEARVYAENDWKAPYASGSAKVDAYVICPCSMWTVGHARGRRDGEPHPPRRLGRAEGGRSSCSCRARRRSRRSTCDGLATLRQAGAVILFAAPGFYHGGRDRRRPRRLRRRARLDQLGLDQALVRRWGQ